MFDYIETIDDVLPYIKHEPSIAVMEKIAPCGSKYTVIDYMLVTDTTFSAYPVSRECRGIIFDGAGKIVRRPLHKFFNYGEKQNYTIDLSKKHAKYQKLDGSMISTFMLGDVVYYGTRAGITDIGNMARDHAYNLRYVDYTGFTIEMFYLGYTPIFEFCSPRNRIVLQYDTESLVLTQMRDMHTGQYLDYRKMINLAEPFGVPVNAPLDIPHDNITALVEHIKPLQGEEGIVLCFHDDFIKIKADEYVRIHRAKDTMRFEKNVLNLVLRGEEDDLIASLPEDDASRLRVYANDVKANVAKTTRMLSEWFKTAPKTSRKEYAAAVMTEMKRFAPVLFKKMDGNDIFESMTKNLLTYTSSNNKIEEIRDIIKVRWNEVTIEE